LEAQGEAEAVVTVRKGQTEGLRQISEVGFDVSQLLAVQGLETVRQTIGPTDKTLLLPSDLASLAGLAGALGRIWGNRNPEPPATPMP
jgi:hypothetical protein